MKHLAAALMILATPASAGQFVATATDAPAVVAPVRACTTGLFGLCWYAPPEHSGTTPRMTPCGHCDTGPQTARTWGLAAGQGIEWDAGRRSGTIRDLATGADMGSVSK